MFIKNSILRSYYLSPETILAASSLEWRKVSMLYLRESSLSSLNSYYHRFSFHQICGLWPITKSFLLNLGSGYLHIWCLIYKFRYLEYTKQLRVCVTTIDFYVQFLKNFALLFFGFKKKKEITISPTSRSYKIIVNIVIVFMIIIIVFFCSA